MCRGNSHGGRRCPGQSTTAAKERAAANRRNNRRAKKNIKKFFATQGMDSTAEAVDDLAPAQIPGLMNAMGLDPNILGDGTRIPVASNASVEHRSADDVIEIATKEAKDKDLTEFQVQPVESVEGDTDTPVKVETAPTQEEISTAFSALISSAMNEERKSPIIDMVLSENSQDLNEVYQVVNRMDLPDDSYERRAEFNRLMDTINENTYEKMIPNKKEMTDSLYAEVFHGDMVDQKEKTAKNVTVSARNRVTKNFDSVHQAFMDGEMDGDTYQALRDINQKDTSLFDYGGGFYYSERRNTKNEPHGGFRFIYAPNGFDDPTSVVASESSYIDRKPKMERYRLEGLGFNNIDEDTMREWVRHPRFTTVATKLSQEAKMVHGARLAEEIDDPYYSQRASDAASSAFKRLTESKVPQITDSDVEDLSISHRISSGQTFVQKNMEQGITLPEQKTAESVRRFRMGLIPTGTNEISPRSADFAQKLINRSDLRYTSTTTKILDDTHKPEVESAVQWLKNAEANGSQPDTAMERIEEYTGMAYTSYASAAMDVHESKEYTDKLEEVNNTVRAYQEHNNTAPRTLYRGVRVPMGMTREDFFNQAEVGEVNTTTKITSSTYSPQTVDGFSGENNVVTVFHTRKGMPVEDISKFKEEREILLPAGEQYVLVGKEEDEDSGQYILHYADKEDIDARN